jgi:PAS domain S-box-containing protein
MGERHPDWKREPALASVRHLFEVTSDAVLCVALTREPGRVTDLNPSAERFLGRTRPDLRDVSLADLVAPDDRDLADRFLADLAEAGAAVGELRLLRSDGQLCEVQVSGHRLVGSPSPVAMLVATPTPEERRETPSWQEEELALFSATVTAFVNLQADDDVYAIIAHGLQQLADCGLIVVSAFDESTGRFSVNHLVAVSSLVERARETLGFDPRSFSVPLDERERGDMMSGRMMRLDGGFHRISFGRIPRVVSRGLERMLSLGDFYGMGISRQGKLYGSLIMALRRGRKLGSTAIPEAFVNLASVALQRQSALVALRESRQQLLHAQKMESVGRLAGGTAHDFNNLLTVILGYCDLLQRRHAGDDRTLTMVAGTRTAAEQAVSATRNLLRFSRRDVARIERLDLNDLVAAVQDMLRRLIGGKVELVIQCDPEPLFVQADRSQLEQVLMNLVVNASDAMADGGTLTIRTGSAVGQRSEVRDLVSLPCVLSVMDTGDGMDDETRARAFEPFFTTKDRDKGTGLGLSTVYGIIEGHGGVAHVISSPGQGCEIILRLPRSEDPAPPSLDEPRPQPSSH